MSAKTAITAAQRALEDGDLEGAAEHLERYRALRASGEAQPFVSIDMGAGYSKPLVIGGDETAEVVADKIADVRKQRAKDAADEAEYLASGPYVPTPRKTRKKRARNPPAKPLSLWALRHTVVGGWQWTHERDVTTETSAEWLAKFHKDEPRIKFVVSARAPKVPKEKQPWGGRYKNPPKKRAVKRTGAAGINRASLKNAVGLYRKFREAEPQRTRAVRIELPKALMSMGRVSAVEYETTHRGITHKYRHDFVPGSRPTLTASGKKNGLFLLGGRYHVTERGIVDLDPAGREVEDKAGEVVQSN